MRTKKWYQAGVFLLALIVGVAVRADSTTTPLEQLHKIITDYSFKAVLQVDNPVYNQLREAFEDQQIEKAKTVLSKVSDSYFVAQHSWEIGHWFALQSEQLPNLLQYFIDEGLDVNVRDPSPQHKNPLIMDFANAGKKDLIAVLLSNDADINASVCRSGFFRKILKPNTALDDARNVETQNYLSSQGAVFGKRLPNDCNL